MEEKELKILQTVILLLDGSTDSEIMFNGLLPYKNKAKEIIKIIGG